MGLASSLRDSASFLAGGGTSESQFLNMMAVNVNCE